MSRKTCGVVITSYNRCDDLRFTCQQLRGLKPPPDEIIICLDGSTDGSKEILVKEFPECHVIENPIPEGSIPSRDRAFRLVKSDLIITLDDDSYPTDPAFVQKVSDVVMQHPEAGAITFPEIRNDGKPASANLGPDSPGHYIRDFPNCAGVMLREVYGREAEYPPFFSHAYAEPDYCLQLYSAGYAVWFEPSLLIRHHFTPKERNTLSRHWLNARNEFWSVLMRCPFPYVLAIAPLRVLRQFIFAFGKGWTWWSREPKWWWGAIRGIGRCLANRKPVSWRSFLAWTRLARRPARTLEHLRTLFGERVRVANLNSQSSAKLKV